MGVRSKLIIIILSTSTLCIAMVAILLSMLSAQNMKLQLINELNLTAELMADNVTGALAFDDYERSKDILGSLSNNSNMQLGCLYDLNNYLVASYHSVNVNKNSCPAEALSGMQTVNNESLSVALPVQQGETMYGAVYLRSDIKPYTDFVHKQLIAVSISVLAVLTVVAVPLASILQKIISKPIHDLADTSALIQYGSHKEGGVTAKTSQNEIEQIRDALGLLRSYMDKGEVQLEKKSNDFLTVSRNKMLSLKYLSVEADTAHGSSRVIREYFKEGEGIDSAEAQDQILDVNAELSKQLKDSVAELYDLAGLENAILMSGEQNVNLEEAIIKAYGTIFLKDDPNIRLNIIYKDDASKEIVTYASALDRLMENIFSLFGDMIVPEHPHTVNATVKHTEKKILLAFELKTEEGVNTTIAQDDMDQQLEKKVFLAKYFHTMLYPEACSHSFSIDIEEDILRITCVLPLKQLDIDFKEL